MKRSTSTGLFVYIKLHLLSDGERFPILYGRDSHPMFEPLVWTESAFRAGSSASMEIALRGAMFVHLFFERHGLDLASRIQRGRILSEPEISALVRDASEPMANLRRPLRDRRKRRASTLGVGHTINLMRRLPQLQKTKKVLPSTAAQRLHYSVRYLSWLSDRNVACVLESSKSSGRQEQRVQRYRRDVSDNLDKIRARTPNASASDRQGIGHDATAALLNLVQSDGSINPWSQSFVRKRNEAIVVLLLALGLRRGELLGIYVKDFDRRLRMLEVVRRQDNPDDIRIHQPNVKTRERILPLSEAVAQPLERYLIERNKITRARKHGFLFVAQNGSPLSRSAITEIFRTIRKVSGPELNKLTAHILRHEWNDIYSENADAAGVSAKEEADTRRYNMGWSEKSEMPAVYNKRRTKRKADEQSLNTQKLVMTKK
jgi:integrase